jgi:16S rRNA (cytosine1407-C5)-methyltransferase
MLPPAEVEEFLVALARPLRKCIRVNTLRVSVKEFQQLAAAEGWQLTPVPWCATGFWIDRESHALPLGRTWLHAAGLFYIQEAASMLPPELLSVEPGQIVLDLAAAPGSKTTQLAGLMAGQGLLVANEPALKRIKSLSCNLDRAGVTHAAITRKDGNALPQYFPECFDRILLDAPCTGEATYAKDASALERWDASRPGKLAELQESLFHSAIAMLRVGGRLVYSTCTFAPEENEMLIARMLERYGEALELVPAAGANGLTQYGELTLDPRVAGCRRLWPQRDGCEGFFAAIVEKRAHTPQRMKLANAREAQSPFATVPTKRGMELVGQLGKYFGTELRLPENVQLEVRGDELWARPRRAARLAARVHWERAGVRLAKLSRTGQIIRITHLGVGLLAASATEHIAELDRATAEKYLTGVDTECPAGVAEGQVIVRHAGQYLGLALARDGKLKNQLPREFTLPQGS